MENRYEELTYYTFQDILKVWSDEDEEPYSQHTGQLLHDYYTEFFNEYNVSFPNNIREIQGQDIRLVDDVERLFDYVYARYWKHYVGYTKEDEDLNLYTNENIREFFYKLLNIASFTYDKYKDLLGYWANLKTKLMSGIKQTTTGQIRFNDTPQDISAVSDDKFASNITKSTQEAESSANTPVERLKEINDKIVNIYLEWTNEFDKIFIEEGNI